MEYFKFYIGEEIYRIVNSPISALKVAEELKREGLEDIANVYKSVELTDKESEFLDRYCDLSNTTLRHE